MKKEFHQILREKIEKNTVPKPNSCSHSHEDTDPLHLAFLMGNIRKTQVSKQAKNQFYYQTNQDRHSCNQNCVTKISSIALPTPPSPPTHLNQLQQTAWLWFWKKGAPLNEIYTRQELQKQFRKLAQILHPDKNGHPKANDLFIQLREYYHQLGLCK